MTQSDFADTPLIFETIVTDPVMYDLFCNELESQCKILMQGLIDIERNPENKEIFQTLLRSAHSIKGAARVLNIQPVVVLAHAIEDCFVSAQKSTGFGVTSGQIDPILQIVDMFVRFSRVPLSTLNDWLREQIPVFQNLLHAVKNQWSLTNQPSSLPSPSFVQEQKKEQSREDLPPLQQSTNLTDRVLRVTAQNMNRLMGLAGESVVESRWLYPFGESLGAFKKKIQTLSRILDLLGDSLQKTNLNDVSEDCMNELHKEVHEMRETIVERMSALDNFVHRYANLSDRLYQEVIDSRMRPFSDGIATFPRMVRDISRQLGKKVKLEIEGGSTPVDRDILEKLETPLGHLLRNAIDHGIETPAERLAAGKPEEGIIKLEAHHHGGILVISVADDGKGLQLDELRNLIAQKNFTSSTALTRLSDLEVIDCLFLPGFSTSQSVSEISGRGVGLNIVRKAVNEVGGTIQTTFVQGKGMRFDLKLPLTLSVIRTLLVEVSGEIYAFPLARIEHALFIEPEKMQRIGSTLRFSHNDQNIILFDLCDIFELPKSQLAPQGYSVIIVNGHSSSYGLRVDKLLGERALVVREIDSRLGKIRDIHAFGTLEDGSPILICDIHDIIRDIESHLHEPAFNALPSQENKVHTAKKRILIVDDSMTIREEEKRILINQGYEIEVAVNGLDAWNALRTSSYKLMITDIEMPRMNGIDLLHAIKQDVHLQHLPVVILSYKEAEEDIAIGLQAGADRYLTKTGFQNGALLDAVRQLIGNA